MTVTRKVDITRVEHRGLATGINEFDGYAAFGLAGLATAWMAQLYGPRVALLGFASDVIALALATALLFVRENLPWARAERHCHASGTHTGTRPRDANGLAEHPTSRQVFAYVSFGHPTLSALWQAGVANKVADTLLWVLLPLYLYGNDLVLVLVAWITGVYGLSWGLRSCGPGRCRTASGASAQWRPGCGC